jgi:hypothetical protein
MSGDVKTSPLLLWLAGSPFECMAVIASLWVF